ncbi:MAG: ATP-binding protein [Rikenellaceae bacterium]
MMIKLFLIITIVVQTIATIFAIRLVRTTKYNAIWILFIVGLSVLSAERYLQLIIYNGRYVPYEVFQYTGIVVSIGLSVGVMYAHKLFQYIGRLNQQRSLISKRILTAVIRTEERARSRFSKDLHDGLGPLLSSAKMSLSVIDRAKSEEEKLEIIRNTGYLIDEAIRSLREISNNLSPHILIDFGLARAVTNFINKSANIGSIKSRFNTNLGAKRYDMDLEVILYRVICELINNSLKHSECTRIEISLQHIEGELRLEYSDDGVGFDPNAMMDCGMGLSNITSRINSLNGTLNISSDIGRGMKASIIVAAEQLLTDKDE